MVRTWQSRLASKLEKLQNKLYSSHIQNSGTVIDFIRIKVDLTRQRDIASYLVQSIDVINGIISLPNNVVYSHLFTVSNQEKSAVNIYDIQPITVSIPADSNIEQGDLLLWFIDTGNENSPLYLKLQVKDIQNTVGRRYLLYKKCICSIHDEKLPQEILTYCTKLFSRRKKIQY